MTRQHPIPTIYFLEKHDTMGRMIGYLHEQTDPAQIDAVLATILQLTAAIRKEATKWRKELQLDIVYINQEEE